LTHHGVTHYKIGQLIADRNVIINHPERSIELEIDHYRSIWKRTSDLLDHRQSRPEQATARAVNYMKQPLQHRMPTAFTGMYKELGLDPVRKKRSGLTAAIIREQGVNSDREMAYALWLAGFDVKDIHMTDLISGAEDLNDIQFVVFVGGFSNSDVLGSAKGWAGSFKFNEKAKRALSSFYARKDTLSLGVCNGCQLMMELELIYPENPKHPKMHHNTSGKFECAFVDVIIPESSSVLLKSLAGARLGVWIAHGEGRFRLNSENDYVIPMKYAYEAFPGNPNGSSYAAAALCSTDGRHLAMMPHLERSLFPWNWPYKETGHNWEVSPWMIPFANARQWLEDLK